MFQLRFLLGSPRRLSPHIFQHRDYRGQRTVQDPFHAEYSTFICHATEQQSSHQVMAMLLEHANQHQRGNHLISLVELYNPDTGERAHLKGDEVVLRQSDIEAAKKVVANAEKTANPWSQRRDNNLHEAYWEAEPGTKIVLTTDAGNTDLNGILERLKEKFPEASIGATTDAGRFQHTDIFKPKPESTEDKTEEQTPSTKIEEQPEQPQEQTLLDRIKAAIAENPKTATMLSNDLGVSADAIKDAVAAEGSCLINKGGWIKPAT